MLPLEDENVDGKITTTDSECKEESLIINFGRYSDEAIKDRGYSLQMIMMENNGCFWKKRVNSWGDRIYSKCVMDEEEYKRVHQASPTLPKLISNVAWTKVKLWDLARKNKEGSGYIPLTELELIEEAFKCVVHSSQTYKNQNLRLGFIHKC